MKLRNKKTGEIVSLEGELLFDNEVMLLKQYDSLAELNEEWEDYEEPKCSALDLMILTLTNFIENEPDEDKVDLEDCKQMLEKLKAWKRLKDKGFRFAGYTNDSGDLFSSQVIRCRFDYFRNESRDDLNLLFGGEE